MSQLTQVQVTPTIPGAEAPKVETPVVKGNQAPATQQTPPTPERPKWLPEKFKSEQEMADAYSALEKKLGSTPPKVDETPPVEGEKKKEETPKLGTPTPVIPQEKFDAFTKEFQENGQLSEASMADLAKAGIPKQIVDQYILGLQKTAASDEAELMDAAGGKETFAKVSEWAGKNLPAAEIQAYNDLLASATKEQAKVAIAGMASRYEAANGRPAKLIHGTASGAAVAPFKSSDEVTRAMSDPRYATDEGFRQEVMERIGASSVL